MSKFLTREQMRDLAKKHGLSYAEVRTVAEVESKGAGFNADGSPKILFERHVFWEQLGNIRWFTVRLRIMAKFPRICNPFPGSYGKFSEQHEKLQIAASYNREAAMNSASWGLGQVMGYHWQKLGYGTQQEFINAMFKDEASQLDAMLRFIDVFGLKGYLKRHEWAGFAVRYNGRGYRKNRYDEKLAAAYEKYKSFE